MEVLPTKHWRHVPSKENPADIASRGIDPKCLPDCKLWWQGPPWLRLETSSWPKAESSCDEASDEFYNYDPFFPAICLHPFTERDDRIERSKKIYLTHVLEIFRQVLQPKALQKPTLYMSHV
ncbi:hypothetical protein TNCV_1688801 [Trichonephila clavipes]|nr:hypothetical protein TNCV_1688801 [Trichonephila clavipes]